MDPFFLFQTQCLSPGDVLENLRKWLESQSAFLQLLELVSVHTRVKLDNDLSLAQMGHPIFQSDASD